MNTCRRNPRFEWRTAWMREARLRNTAVDVSLSCQIGSVSNVSAGIGRKRHVQFRDVDLDAQRREACSVGGHAGDVWIETVDVHLQANAVDAMVRDFKKRGIPKA